MNQQKTKNVLILVLIILLLFLFFYSHQKSNENENLQNIFLEEKAELQQDLDEMIKDYTDVVVGKKRLADRLEVELIKMKNLRDSIKLLKSDNFGLIRKYRSRIASLERENKKLFIQIDSLNSANDALTQENVIANEILQQKDSVNETLTEKNKELEAKVAIGGIIKTSPVKAIAMKERSSGKLTSTSRSSRTDAFRINFDLLENPITSAGEKRVYIQIIDENKNVIAPKGKTDLKNGQKVQYTDSLEVNYNNNRLSLVSLILVNRDDIKKGKYIISAFVDGVYSGNTTIKLR
ncbi:MULTISPECIES: hypothetical protein [Tenacibaculum]|uniref:Uncharacterized protein n=2 Tax=Tenacibaculum TaxID=104267 RepID=A0AAE9MNY7_9FLAO|nr:MULTISPECIES: hypothetical protein [Tenacibaculum]GFD75455.1 hypothetical protein KUL113_48750 [Tenacibaculum sp. KUL113]GFD78281.1 hypothetical protein KUL118_11430 [Tenacibaculum sp. KUL118]GFD91543.1 hypothetical protein KUL154_02760 [Alteromonas sp. KUL154]GFE00208.1 hypothetical protein KUL156_28000 [Alteromonas sp. KUL156]AZJ32906.1 hypothetical protein D6200_10215 [Tenacibaculum mesophilum]